MIHIYIQQEHAQPPGTDRSHHPVLRTHDLSSYILAPFPISAQ